MPAPPSNERLPCKRCLLLRVIKQNFPSLLESSGHSVAHWVCIVQSRYWLDCTVQNPQSWFDSRNMQHMLLFSTASSRAPKPNLFNVYRGVSFLRGKAAGSSSLPFTST